MRSESELHLLRHQSSSTARTEVVLAAMMEEAMAEEVMAAEVMAEVEWVVVKVAEVWAVVVVMAVEE